GIHPTPLTWPIGQGPDFAGVADRTTGGVWRFARSAHGATRAGEELVDPAALAGLGAHGDEAAADHDQDRFLAGETTPVLFGSALWNFGVRLLLDAIADLIPAPRPEADAGGVRHPLDGPLAGQVFKIQANLDPRHRDRLAFLRIHRGRFERGMNLVNARTGRTFSTKYAHQVFGRDRDTVD
ncbi:MAG: peptide chain release factor 3, partial [Gemmatimonadetes bacterium]|nr:peptide chain release factor 3 [Gemmatimonadota bacterium]NIR36278.1 peptide chain release factor 3 [Actinomycetota bacterium]NIQ59071.1 peptide chain release factor 3 [Gemmatimonadota bacterium]NIS30579.1 peptide chain release factor 3 [Actinomycetota bacterium]NIU65786.1 peptide chain release factor 3 [Actinomycetota bacterium]